MTMPQLLLVVGISVAAAGAVVVTLRRRTVAPDAVLITFDTAAHRARAAWAQFWARDPFVQAQKKRTGLAFATYHMPSGESVAVHLAASDLRQHTLILGATGTGKSSLLEALAVARMRSEEPFALIDLHGDLYTRVARWAGVIAPPKLLLLDFTDPDALPGWNPLERMPGVDVGRQVDLLVGTLKRLYAGEEAASWAWGVKVEELMRYGLRACIESTSVMSLVDLPQFFLLPALRKQVLTTVSKETATYFATRFGKREEMYVSAVLNKLEPLLGSRAIQLFLGKAQSRVDLFGAMERGETILVNLAKGYLGPTADVMGRLLVNVLRTAALGRERMRPETRKPYALLLDEAHVVAGVESGLEDFLVAARKYNVFVTLAAQGLSLFPPSFRPHLLGNTGRQFFFRLPYSEAKQLAPDLFEAQGSVFREQVLPNKPVDEPLLSEKEEIAWRTRDLANLPVGYAYWLAKSRPYKARRIRVLPPVRPPKARELRETLEHATQIAVAQRHEATPNAVLR